MKQLQNFWTAYRFPIIGFLIWRVYLFILGTLGFSLLTFKASFPYIDQILIASGYPQWLWQWGNFDGVHYLDLAMRGYHAQGLHVFFPIFPILINVVNLVVNNYFLAGFILSNTLFLVASVVFYKFLKEKYNLSTARWGTALLFCFPTSFFFGSIYTESLFLLLVVLSFYLTGFKAALVASVAGATRLVGTFLALPFLLGKKKWLFFVACAGFAIYILYTWYFYHSPLLMISDQANFQNARASSLSTLVSPPQVVWRYLKIFATGGIDKFDTWLAVLEFVSFVGGVILLTYLTWKRKMEKAYLVFAWPALILPSLSGTLSSMPRYLLVIFPIYIAFALIKNKTIKLTLLVFSSVLMTVLTILFVRGYFIS